MSKPKILEDYYTNGQDHIAALLASGKQMAEALKKVRPAIAHGIHQSGRGQNCPHCSLVRIADAALAEWQKVTK